MDSNQHSRIDIKKIGELVLRILAVVADIVGIISFLLMSSTSVSPLGIQLSFTPWFALAIWIIGIFIYLGLLQWHWNLNKENKHLESPFGRYLIHDLARKFSNPFLLLPAVIFGILLPWILVEIVQSSGTLKSFFPLFFGELFVFGIVGIVVYAMATDTPKYKVKNDVEKNWNKWVRIIQAKLTRKRWITVDDLLDQATTLEVSVEDLDYALSKYAIEFPKQAVYGIVYSRKNHKPITSSAVLISLKNLPRDEFYYSG